MAGDEPVAPGDGDPQISAILLPGPLPSLFCDALSQRYLLLKPWESPMPRPLFLSAHAAIVRALVVSGHTSVDAETIASLPHLGCIVTTSAGLNHIDLSECSRRGIAVANTANICSEDVADYAVGLLIDVLRRVSASDRYVRQGLWPINGEHPLGFKLGGKRVGIAGLGSIGSEIAKRLDAFGCIISYISRQRKQLVPYGYFSNIHDLAAESDVLIITCSLTTETYHMIDENVLGALAKKGIVINMSRGPVVDEKELVRHLKEGKIGGAGLDVFENEPDVPEELFLWDNVVLSPHVAVCTPESTSDVIQLMMANLEAFFQNRPFLTPV